MSALSGLATALAAVCGLLVLLTAAVLADRPRGPVMAAYASVGPYVLQLGWPVLVLGLVVPRWWLSVTAAGCCVAALGLLARAAPRGVCDPDATGTTLRVVTANLFYRNDRGLDSWPAIAAFEPDLVLLQEVSAHSASWLPPAGWHAHVDARYDAFGTAVLTRTPPRAVDWVELGGLPQLRVCLRVGDTEVTALSLHPQAPVTRAADRRWRRQLRELAALIQIDPTQVLVAAGDFNATPAHGAFRALLRATGLRDARSSRRRMQGTWPSGGAGSPRHVPHRIMSLDHILVRGATVRSVQVLDAGSSDHHPLAVELALPPPT